MTDEPQPEYCDCPGFHDGSCHARQINTLLKKIDVLRAEVKAWRSGWYDEDASEGELARARAATDAAKALEDK